MTFSNWLLFIRRQLLKEFTASKQYLFIVFYNTAGIMAVSILLRLLLVTSQYFAITVYQQLAFAIAIVVAIIGMLVLLSVFLFTVKEMKRRTKQIAIYLFTGYEKTTVLLIYTILFYLLTVVSFVLGAALLWLLAFSAGTSGNNDMLRLILGADFSAWWLPLFFALLLMLLVHFTALSCSICFLPKKTVMRLLSE
nr:FtsX-like permease family protein [Evansella caseinilytica]